MRKSIIKQFKKYVSNFNTKDIAIIRKKEHSERVMKESLHISKMLCLNKQDQYLARVIGLLHDYARFPQWTKYHTYSDLKSIDHGDLGAKLLIDNLEIENFYNNKEDYDVIKNAIKYHNKLVCGKELDEYNLMHANIIRDADKLDIFYIYAKGILKIDEDNEVISDFIEKEFFANNLLNHKDITNQSENLLLKLSMFYDLNYLASIKKIKKKNYLWKIYNRLENKEKYLKYFNHIDQFIEERLK